jgi:hypothetical protein
LHFPHAPCRTSWTRVIGHCGSSRRQRLDLGRRQRLRTTSNSAASGRQALLRETRKLSCRLHGGPLAGLMLVFAPDFADLSAAPPPPACRRGRFGRPAGNYEIQGGTSGRCYGRAAAFRIRATTRREHFAAGRRVEHPMSFDFGHVAPRPIVAGCSDGLDCSSAPPTAETHMASLGAIRAPPFVRDLAMAPGCDWTTPPLAGSPSRGCDPELVGQPRGRRSSVQ